MRGRTSSITIILRPKQRETLESWLRRQKTPLGLEKRVRAILLLAEGTSFSQTSERVGLGEQHLRKWARRFKASGIVGLQDRTRLGRAPVFPPSSRLVSGEERLRTAGY